MPKIVKVPDNVIVDFGDKAVGHTSADMVVIPESLAIAMLDGNPYNDGPVHGGPKVTCGGFEYFMTRNRREAVRLLHGTGWLAQLVCGEGSRSWNNWEDRMPVGDNVLSIAAAVSRGGGMWWELSVVPVLGYMTAEQVQYQQAVDDWTEVGTDTEPGVMATGEFGCDMCGGLFRERDYAYQVRMGHVSLTHGVFLPEADVGVYCTGCIGKGV